MSGGNDLEFRREAAPGNVQSRDGSTLTAPSEVDGMDVDFDERDTDPREENVDQRQGVEPWYSMRSFWNNAVQSTPPINMQDSREDDGIMERDEGDDSFDCNARIREPLKRSQERGGRTTKRRRLAVDNDTRMSFFHAVPAMTQSQQAVMEYVAPSCLTPMFFFLGYTPFALSFVIIMFILHSIQTAVSTFGPGAAHLRIKAWIPPLIHHLMDSYIWNHGMINSMLLVPEWFGPKAYWLGVFFISSQHHYLVVSLKTHYVNNKGNLTKRGCYEMEVQLMDITLLYGLAILVFSLARIVGSAVVFWIGFIGFNSLPISLVLAHKKRLDANQLASRVDEINPRGGNEPNGRSQRSAATNGEDKKQL